MCWMHHKKELKKRGSKPLTLLDEGFAYNVPTVYPLCRHCQEVFPRSSRYSENDALANEKNIIRCVTATLKPCLHAIDPEEINRIIKIKLKLFYRKRDRLLPSRSGVNIQIKVFSITMAGIVAIGVFRANYYLSLGEGAIY